MRSIRNTRWLQYSHTSLPIVDPCFCCLDPALTVRLLIGRMGKSSLEGFRNKSSADGSNDTVILGGDG